MFVRLRAIAHHLAPSYSLARARMSTVVHNDNAACCSIPPVKSDYTPKGSYKSYAGFDKVCVRHRVLRNLVHGATRRVPSLSPGKNVSSHILGGTRPPVNRLRKCCVDPRLSRPPGSMYAAENVFLPHRNGSRREGCSRQGQLPISRASSGLHCNSLEKDALWCLLECRVIEADDRPSDHACLCF